MLETPPQISRDLGRLVRLFEQAEREVELELARAIARENDYTAAVRQRKLTEIRGILAELRDKTLNGNPEHDAGPAWDLIRSSYRTGSRRAEEGAGSLITERSFSGFHQDAAEVLYANLTGRLEDGIAYAGRRVDDYFRSAAMRELLQGVIQGRTRRQTSDAIVERLQQRGIKGFRDKTGREWSLSKYAEMVARTTAREAHTAGTVNRLASNGLDLVKISEHAHESDVCNQYEGRIFSISGTSTRYPSATGNLPPYHPNCVHVTTPWIERFN